MRYFITLNAKVIGVERPIFPLNTQGYLVGVIIFVKVLPELTNGIAVIGFLTKLPPRAKGDPEIMWMMVNMNDGIIMGIT
jgi:hypothetical protein